MRKEVVAGVSLVVIDILNLAEQFGIYFIAKESSLDESTQQRFFFILFGIAAATLLQPLLLWSKLKMIYSILIEVGELTAYLVILPRTNNLIIVATIFFGFEIILHIICVITVKSNREEISSKQCLRDYCIFPLRLLYFGLMYSSPMIFLFLNPDSNFRDTYYEILLILNLFFGLSYIDLSLLTLCAPEDEPPIDEMIYLVWEVIMFIIYNILAFIILITTMVFAGQAIHKNATGEEPLAQYDFGVYIYCLVNYGLLALGQCSNCCAASSKFKAQQSNR